MGTRNLTIIKLDNEIKVAKYCQWDGHLDCQGKSIANFIQNNLDIKKLKKNVRNIKIIDEKKVNELWQQIGADDTGLVSFSISDKFKKKFPLLHRDFGGGSMLNLIQNGKISIIKYCGKTRNTEKTSYKVDLNNIEMLNDYGFINDGLFCEYSYLIDLDNKKVSIYINGNTLLKTFSFKAFTENNLTKLQSKLDKLNA